MSLVVAMRKPDGNILMGCDSLMTDGYVISQFGVPKIIYKNEMFLGIVGDVTGINILSYDLVLRQPKKAEEPDFYVCSITRDAIRKAMHKGGQLGKLDELEKCKIDMIVGFRGCLYKFSGSNMAMAKIAAPFTAVGAGSEFATGCAWYALSQPATTPEDIVGHTLACTQEFSPWVRKPFTVFGLNDSIKAFKENKKKTTAAKRKRKK